MRQRCSVSQRWCRLRQSDVLAATRLLRGTSSKMVATMMRRHTSCSEKDWCRAGVSAKDHLKGEQRSPAAYEKGVTRPGERASSTA